MSYQSASSLISTIVLRAIRTYFEPASSFFRTKYLDLSQNELGDFLTKEGFEDAVVSSSDVGDFHGTDADQKEVRYTPDVEPSSRLIDIAQLRALDQCDSISALSAAVSEIVTGLHIDYWFYAFEPPLVSDQDSPLHMGTYPAAWVERYLKMHYANIDPVVSYCHDHAIPFSWDNADVLSKRIIDSHLQKVRHLFEEAREFGLGAGVSVPLHGPGVCWALMSYASRDRPASDFDQLLPDLQLLSYYVHEVGRRFARARLSAPLPVLTKRERECLSWAAEGKTSWEIGQLLNISERTSIFHLQNAAHKLAVSGRQAAIERATSMDLIKRN